MRSWSFLLLSVAAATAQAAPPGQVELDFEGHDARDLVHARQERLEHGDGERGAPPEDDAHLSCREG